MKKIQAAQWADPLCRLNRRRASSTATLGGAALALTAVVLTTAREATPDEGLQEALEGGGSGALLAVPPHHQDQGMSTSGISEARMATSEAGGAVERPKISSNARIIKK